MHFPLLYFSVKTEWQLILFKVIHERVALLAADPPEGGVVRVVYL